MAGMRRKGSKEGRWVNLARWGSGLGWGYWERRYGDGHGAGLAADGSSPAVGGGPDFLPLLLFFFNFNFYIILKKILLKRSKRCCFEAQNGVVLKPKTTSFWSEG
jgi:hypothetical protein